MKKYIIYYNENIAKALPKQEVTRDVKKAMREKGYKKHHVEVDAENEKEALLRIKSFNNDYLESLKGFSGSVVICTISVIVIALIYFFGS